MALLSIEFQWSAQIDRAIVTSAMFWYSIRCSFLVMRNRIGMMLMMGDSELCVASIIALGRGKILKMTPTSRTVYRRRTLLARGTMTCGMISRSLPPAPIGFLIPPLLLHCDLKREQGRLTDVTAEKF